MPARSPTSSRAATSAAASAVRVKRSRASRTDAGSQLPGNPCVASLPEAAPRIAVLRRICFEDAIVVGGHEPASTIALRGRHASSERGVPGQARVRPSACRSGPGARWLRSGSRPARRCSRLPSAAARPCATARSPRSSRASARRTRRCRSSGAASRRRRRCRSACSTATRARALRSVVPGKPFGVSLFRQAPFGGAFVNLGGVDGLARWVRLRSGRLPKPCTPQLCELVLVDGAGALPRLPFLRVVGRGRLTRDAPLRALLRRRRREAAADCCSPRARSRSAGCRCPTPS